jgi:hypothetical protein
MVQGMPTSGLQGHTTQAFLEMGRSSLLGEMGTQPARYQESPLGDETNQMGGEGSAGAFPRAGDGPGTGRQPKTVIGQTKAKPRSQWVRPKGS